MRAWSSCPRASRASSGRVAPASASRSAVDDRTAFVAGGPAGLVRRGARREERAIAHLYGRRRRPRPGSASRSSTSRAFRRVYEPTSVENPMPWRVRLRGNAAQMRPTMLRRLTEIDRDRDERHQLARRLLAWRRIRSRLASGCGRSGGLGARADRSGVFSVLSVRRRAAGEGDWRPDGARGGDRDVVR